MASPFAEAITQSMISGLDPMNGVIRQYAQQQVAQSDLVLDQSRLEMMQKLQHLIDKAKDDNSDAAVIHAYQKMLVKYQS